VSGGGPPGGPSGAAPGGSATALLIHGAWAGSWVWDTVTPALVRAGIRTVAVDLPGTPGSAAGAELATLEGYAAAALDAVPTDADSIVVVGHSGGGVVAMSVAEALGERAAGVAFVAGIMPPAGMTFPELCAEAAASGLALDGGILPHLIHGPSDHGPVSAVPPEAGVAMFFQCAAAADAVAAARRLTAQPDAGLVMRAAWSEAGFGRLPRLYVEALQDRSIPLRLQRYMQARVPGAEVATLDSDHAPQLSATAELTNALRGFISRVCGGPASVPRSDCDRFEPVGGRT
jgi:pimeloyl-ACP methyl ester carboxylesterase